MMVWAILSAQLCACENIQIFTHMEKICSLSKHIMGSAVVEHIHYQIQLPRNNLWHYCDIVCICVLFCLSFLNSFFILMGIIFEYFIIDLYIFRLDNVFKILSKRTFLIISQSRITADCSHSSSCFLQWCFLCFVSLYCGYALLCSLMCSSMPRAEAAEWF